MNCVLLIGAESLEDAAAEEELVQGLPFLDIALAGPHDFGYFINRLFALDRYEEAKGMIEVTL